VPAVPDRSRWVTVSELAEYTYCPRAWWYRAHPPAEGVDPVDAIRRDRGSRYHAVTLGAIERRDRWAGAFVLAFLLSLAVVVAASVALALGR
jgi:hypothetical protein